MSRHIKFSSIGRKLNAEISMGFTYKTNKRKITSIALHCTASPIGRDDDVFTIDKWHLQKWGKNSGIGYHYFIDKDGNIFKGRWVDYIGAHVLGSNVDTIGICREGGTDREKNNVYDATHLQLNAIKKLTRLLISDEMYGLLPSDIKGHNEYKGHSNRRCPMLTDAQMEEIRKG